MQNPWARANRVIKLAWPNPKSAPAGLAGLVEVAWIAGSSERVTGAGGVDSHLSRSGVDFAWCFFCGSPWYNFYSFNTLHVPAAPAACCPSRRQHAVA